MGKRNKRRQSLKVSTPSSESQSLEDTPSAPDPQPEQVFEPTPVPEVQAPVPEPAPEQPKVTLPEGAWVLVHEMPDGSSAGLLVLLGKPCCNKAICGCPAVVEDGERLMPASASGAADLLCACSAVHRTCPRVEGGRLASITSKRAESKGTMAFQLLAAATLCTPLGAVAGTEALQGKMQSVTFRARRMNCAQ